MQLSNVVLGEETLEALLGRVANLAVDLIDTVTGVGVTILDGGRAGTAAATAPFVWDLDEAQYEAGSGPCLESSAKRKPVAVPSLADETRWPHFTIVAREHGITSSLSLPLAVGEMRVGALNLYSAVPAGLVDDTTQVVATYLADHAAIAVVNARTFENERRTALLLQRSLLPDHLPKIPGYELAVRYQPADTTAEVGGDWYDVFAVPGGDTVCVVIGDVMGHGMESASVMGRLRTGVEAYAVDGAAPMDVLRRLDTLLTVIDDGVEDRLATVCCILLEPATGRFQMASAGHLPPAVAGQEGTVRFLDTAGGPPLGAGLHTERSETTAVLAPGEALVLYTDGLVEGRHRSLDDGLSALNTALTGRVGGAEDICQQLVDDLLGGQRQEDDAAIIVLRRCQPETGLVER